MCMGKEGRIAAITISNNTDHYYRASVQRLSVSRLSDRILISEPSGVTTQILYFYYDLQ